MIIRQVTDSDKTAWDEFVHNHPEASPYHLFGWMMAVERAYNFKKCGLVAEDGNRILGALPLVKFKIPLYKPTLVSLPYCDVGSALAESEQVGEKLIVEALSLSKSMQASSLDLRADVPYSGLIKEHQIERTENKVRMLLDLPSSSGELLAGFKSKLRSQIKKAEKNGLRFEIDNTKTDQFYAVFSRNMRDLGSPVHSKKMIEEVVEQFGKYAKLGLVFKEDVPVGGGLILLVGNKVSIPWASTLRTYNRLNPNMLLYWGFLQYATDNGCRQFDFGRSTPGEGTYRFKAQWGASSQPLVWSKILFGNVSVESPREKGAIKDKAAYNWQKLPLPVANFFGSKLRKYITL